MNRSGEYRHASDASDAGWKSGPHAMNFLPTGSSIGAETEHTSPAERVAATVDALTDYAVLLSVAIGLILLMVASAVLADYLWTILGRMGLSSPLSPWFAILGAMLADVWLSLCILNRLISGRWWWRTPAGS